MYQQKKSTWICQCLYPNGQVFFADPSSWLPFVFAYQNLSYCFRCLQLKEFVDTDQIRLKRNGVDYKILIPRLIIDMNFTTYNKVLLVLYAVIYSYLEKDWYYFFQFCCYPLQMEALFWKYSLHLNTDVLQQLKDLICFDGQPYQGGSALSHIENSIPLYLEVEMVRMNWLKQLQSSFSYLLCAAWMMNTVQMLD